MAATLGLPLFMLFTFWITVFFATFMPLFFLGGFPLPIYSPLVYIEGFIMPSLPGVLARRATILTHQLACVGGTG
jgi:hypothetical protein